MRTTFDVLLGEPLKHRHPEVDNHAQWDSVYSTVQSNSAYWGGGASFFSDTVGPSEMKVLNSVPVSAGWACDWALGAITSGGDNVRNSSISCCWNSLTAEIDESFSYIGDINGIQYDTDVLSGYVRLIATNSGLDVWMVRGRREDV